MASLISKLEFNLEQFQPVNKYVLKEISPRYKYKDEKRTNEITGYVYTCANVSTFDILRIFVEGDKPAISSEKLNSAQSEGQHIFVELVNARLKTYFSNATRQLEDSIKADALKIIKNN
jgi:hypothetical protein